MVSPSTFYRYARKLGIIRFAGAILNKFQSRTNLDRYYLEVYREEVGDIAGGYTPTDYTQFGEGLSPYEAGPEYQAGAGLGGFDPRSGFMQAAQQYLPDVAKQTPTFPVARA